MNGSRLSPEPLLLEIWEWVQIEAGCKGYQAKMGGGVRAGVGGLNWQLKHCKYTAKIGEQTSNSLDIFHLIPGDT